MGTKDQAIGELDRFASRLHDLSNEVHGCAEQLLRDKTDHAQYRAERVLNLMNRLNVLADLVVENVNEAVIITEELEDSLMNKQGPGA